MAIQSHTCASRTVIITCTCTLECSIWWVARCTVFALLFFARFKCCNTTIRIQHSTYLPSVLLLNPSYHCCWIEEYLWHFDQQMRHSNLSHFVEVRPRARFWHRLLEYEVRWHVVRFERYRNNQNTCWIWKGNNCRGQWKCVRVCATYKC